MKMVTLTRDMKPWREGDSAALPDELADKLIKAGEAKDPRPYPPPDVAPAVPVAARPALKPARPYFTRKRG